MRTSLALMCLVLLAPSSHGYSYWNDIRHSALLPDSTITVRLENPSGSGDDNYILFEGAGIEVIEMTPILDGPSTLSATVPGPLTDERYYGFRLEAGDELDLMPVIIGDGVDPGPEDLTRLSEDAVGDELFGYDNLDLVDCHVSFSGTRLYAALRNVGGGFPVSQGLTFFGYLLGVADPEVADPDTVFALMQTYEQGGIISPGLYKITGTGFGDLEKIGDVEITEYPTANTLMISCQLSDLASDPYFASWYDPVDPTLGVAGFTQRITLLGGAAEADRSPSGRCYLREFSVAPAVNNLPGLSNVLFLGEGAEATAQIDYLDPDGHCPVVAEVVFDETEAFPLYPQSLDYGTTVTYKTDEGIDPLASGTWAIAAFRFSDDLSNVVEYEVPATGVDESPWADGAVGVVSLAFPNPFSRATSVSLLASATGPARVAVYDARGALVRTLLNGRVESGPTVLTWDGLNDSGRSVGSGIYFLRTTLAGRTEICKLVLAR